jgi:hypothetical protein
VKIPDGSTQTVLANSINPTEKATKRSAEATSTLTAVKCLGQIYSMTMRTGHDHSLVMGKENWSSDLKLFA